MITVELTPCGDSQIVLSEKSVTLVDDSCFLAKKSPFKTSHKLVHLERRVTKTPFQGDHPSTKEGKALDGHVKTITPSYKLGTEKPSHELKIGASGYLPSEKGDYKVSMRHEDYKLTVIDPKVRSSANMPLHSMTLPDAKKEMAGDFPSQHSKRSLIKLEPLEQRRFKSTESRPITTSNYLTESVERHRDMEASRLRDYLKAKESDANKPWNKPGWPGPKKSDDESLRELEHIRKSIETLQKVGKVLWSSVSLVLLSAYTSVCYCCVWRSQLIVRCSLYVFLLKRPLTPLEISFLPIRPLLHTTPTSLQHHKHEKSNELSQCRIFVDDQ
ncbi:hypothetical protein GCK32_013591, partial [Trichostrongylus colubriformis]